MKKALLTLLLALPAAAQMTAPSLPTGTADLRDAFVEAVEEEKKARILSRLSRTAPVSGRDAQALFDLYMRFPRPDARAAALDSLALLDPGARHLEPLFLRYIEEPDPQAAIFGMRGCLRLKCSKALPFVLAQAKKRFAAPSAQDLSLMSEREVWWEQYEALSTLAQWDPERALPILVSRSKEAPDAAGLMGAFLWKESLPHFIDWSRSKDLGDQERAKQGLSAAPAPSVLRETRSKMLGLVLDAKAPRELRHQLALKTGQCSTEEEVTALLKEHEAQKEPDTKLMLAAAVFASRSKLAVPLLTRYAKEDPSAPMRAGALLQLKDLLAPAEYRPLLEWTAANDPDPENKAQAKDELKAFGPIRP